MGHKRNTTTALKVKNISTYIQGVKDQINRHYIIKEDGSEYYLLNGEMIPAQMVEDSIPELQKVAIFKGNGLDGRTHWL